jgi:hypothetical protein
MDLDLDDFDFSESGIVNIVDSIGIMGKMLASNRGIRKQPNMIRLLVAGGLEIVVGYLRATDRALKKKAVSPTMDRA